MSLLDPSSLTLANGNTWLVMPEDEQAAFVVNQLSESMQLKAVNVSGTHRDSKSIVFHSAASRTNVVSDDSNDWMPTNRLLISTDAIGLAAQSGASRPDVASTHVKDNGKGSSKELNRALNRHSLSIESIDTISCRLRPFENNDMLAIQLQHLSFLFTLEAERKGGLLIHGALAEFHGLGVILAGPGGMGKTTASRRLPSPWRSLCDDTTLVVKDERGDYWAHPWPTWSAFMFGGEGASWNVQHAVPLANIFFLSQASEMRVERLKPVDVACLLNDSAEQVSIAALRYMSSVAVRKHRLRRLDSVVSLAKSIPVFQLHLSPTSAFWCEIEEVLEMESTVMP